MASSAPSESTQTSETTSNQKPALTISEVLHLLRDQVQPGRALPETLSTPPWRLSESQSAKCPSWADVNRLLSQSLLVQSSTVPHSDDFDEFILSNASMAVAALVRSYAKAILQPRGQWREELFCVNFGVFLWDPSARESAEDYEGSPYLWLDFNGDGIPIDNTYVDIPNQNETNVEFFFRSRQRQSYVREDPFKTKLRLYLGQDDGLADTVRHNYRIFRDYGNNDHVEKFIVFAFDCVELNPSVKFYDILMRDWLREAFGVVPEDIDAKWASQCWSCMKKGTEDALKKCAKCKRARYCSRECQQEDWPRHRLLHKEIDLTKKVLADREEAQEIKSNVNLHMI